MIVDRGGVLSFSDSTIYYNQHIQLNMDKFCCRKKCKQVSANEKKADCYQLRQGGSSTIRVGSIQNYCARLHAASEKIFKNVKQWDWQAIEKILIKPVWDLKDKILNDPVIRMNFNEGVLLKMPIHTDPQTGREFRLLGDNPFQAMLIINTAATSAPSFENQDITGVPIYALFLDYLQTSWGQSLFSQKAINDSLKALFDSYSNNILKTEKSLEKMEQWVSGPALRFWNPIEYVIPDINNPITMGFACWQDFFLRPFKPDSRPIQGPIPGSGVDEEDIITTVCESYPLVSPSMPVLNVNLKDEFWLKDNKYSLFDIFDANEKKCEHKADFYAKMFQGGTAYQAFLDPWAYHRWHSPVNGEVVATYMIEGCYYLQNPGIIDPDTDDEYINSQPFLTCTSTRRIFIIEADNKKIGHIAIVFVGMAEVSSCVTCMKPGDRVKKGQQIGHFQFGGSSHCVLFQKDCILDFSRNVEKAYYTDPKTNKMLSRRIDINSELATVRNILTPAQHQAFKEKHQKQ